MLDVKLSVMLIEAGIFLVTLILLNQWLFKPLLSFMEKRDLDLESQQKNISSNNNEAKQYEEEIANILKNAKSEASRIKKIALEEAKRESSSMVESEVKNLETSKIAFYSELEGRKEELTKMLEVNSSELKDMLSSKLKGIA